MTTCNLVGLVYSPGIPDAAGVVDSIVTALGLDQSSWVRSVADLGGVADRLEQTQLVVTAGGDGTILRTVHVIAPFAVPIVGINMGRVGFMSELTVDEALEHLPAYLDGGLRVEERLMLQASVYPESEDSPRLVFYALNDVVLGQSGVTRLLDIAATVDGTVLTAYRADAVIVSTATGSTGYAFSAGGPILYPEARDMLVQPVAPHTGLREGLIFPEESVIELRAIGAAHPTLNVDGSQEASLGPDERVVVRRAPYAARFLRAQDPVAFYTGLTARLGLVLHPGGHTAGES